MNEYLTVEQFVRMLNHSADIVGIGTGKGGSGISQKPQELITRKTAAAVIHQALLLAGEADEACIEAAVQLQDLYACKVCVNHIAQVYIKGIMTEWADGLFGVDEKMTRREAEEIRLRVWDKRQRSRPKPPVPAGWKTIMWQEAEQMLKADRKILPVDVRSGEEYAQRHQKGSVNVPLQALFQNPCCVCADRAAVLFLYCRRGYQSRIAASLLTKAGYENVYVVLRQADAAEESGDRGDETR